MLGVKQHVFNGVQESVQETTGNYKKPSIPATHPAKFST